MDLLPAYTHINGIISRKIFEINQNRPGLDDSNSGQGQEDADMIIEVLRELEYEILMTREIFPKEKKYKIIGQDPSDLLSFKLQDDEGEETYNAKIEILNQLKEGIENMQEVGVYTSLITCDFKEKTMTFDIPEGLQLKSGEYYIEFNK